MSLIISIDIDVLPSSFRVDELLNRSTAESRWNFWRFMFPFLSNVWHLRLRTRARTGEQYASRLLLGFIR